MQKVRGKLAYRNYGFECNFMTNENEVKKIIREFRDHTMQEHYTDYPHGILMKYLVNEE